MKQIPIDEWEDQFIEICEKYLDEEPFYPYEHLWKKGYNALEAFEKYLGENEDYLEQFYDLTEVNSDFSEQKEYLSIINTLKKEKVKKEAKVKLSKFCPECAREIGKSGICKCGYKNNEAKSKSLSETDMAAQWLAENDLDNDELDDDEDFY